MQEDFVLLTNEECLVLIEKAQKGDLEAKNTLVERNYPLIKSVIARFRNKGVEYDDLYQLGCVGFLKAIKNFDISFNVRFSTYAVPMIAGEVKRYLRDDGSIKVSRILKSLSSKIGRFVEEYRKTHDFEPSVGEIAKKFDIDETDVMFAVESGRQPVSLYEKCDDSENSPNLLDRIVVDDGGQEKLLKNLVVKEAIQSLCKRDRKIVFLRYFRGKTQSEIASLLNVSQVQVSRLESKILAQLKYKMKE